MLKRITCLARMPIQSLSGYGFWSRQILYTMAKCRVADYLDINIWPCNWGHTPLTALEESCEINDTLNAIIQKPKLQVKPDIFMTITVPTEFQRIGKLNVGITAACESDRISVNWINKINNEMDVVFAISRWTAQMMTNTKYSKRNSPQGPIIETIAINKPVNVWSPSVDTKIFHPDIKCNLDLKIKTKKNFLFVGHWLKGDYGKDRKNIGVLVRNFLQTFLDKKDVGLILKTSGAHHSLLDRREILNKIESIKKTMIHNPNNLSLPKIYLLHGDLSDNEMAQLYNHPSLIAYVSVHHGEGWGTPITEAMACNVPALLIPWSGNSDYLKDECFLPVPFILQEIPDDSLWDDIFIKGAKWAVVDEKVFPQALIWIYNNIKDAKRIGVKGGNYIRDNFSLDMMQIRTDTIMQNMLNIVNRTVDKSKLPFKEI